MVFCENCNKLSNLLWSNARKMRVYLPNMMMKYSQHHMRRITSLTHKTPHPFSHPPHPNSFALEKCPALTFSLTKLSFISCIKCLLIPLKLLYMKVLFLWCFNPLKRHLQSSTSMYWFQLFLFDWFITIWNLRFCRSSCPIKE